MLAAVDNPWSGAGATLFYTLLTFAFRSQCAVPYSFRYSALALALIATAALAQESSNDNADDGSANSGTWREGVMAQCQQQFSAEQCSDPQFLEDQFHLQSLEIAHRAAMRRTGVEKQALRELTLQRVCNVSSSASCSGNNDPRCVVQVEQACATLKAQAAACIQTAKNYCASVADSNCLAQQIARCPSAKKQPIEQLLAKYPKLSTEQKFRLAQIAQELDAKQGNWFTRLLSQVGF